MAPKRFSAEFDDILNNLERDFSSISSITCDESTVTVTAARLADDTDVPPVVQILFTDISEYPNSGVLLLCDNDSRLQTALFSQAQKFQDKATLLAVITEVERALSSHANAAPGEDLLIDEGSDNDSDAGSYDEGGESDGALDMVLEADDHETLVAEGQNLGRWQRFETSLGAADAARHEAAPEAKLQIFEPKEAFQILARELLDIQRELSGQLVADTVGDDLYTWDVQFGGWRDGSAMAEDMAVVSRKWSFSSVQLQLQFKRGLHPFCPPLLTVRRPRLQPPFAGAVASHPLLQLENWDPWRTQKQLLLLLRAYIEEHARVDIDSEWNNLQVHDRASYSRTELQLQLLESLTNLQPRCYSQYRAIYEARELQVDAQRIQALAPINKRSRIDSSAKSSTPQPSQPASKADNSLHQELSQTEITEGSSSPGRYWAAGTGYGTGRERDQEVWDAAAAAKAQKARDLAVEDVLVALRGALALDFGSSVVAAMPPPVPLQVQTLPSQAASWPPPELERVFGAEVTQQAATAEPPSAAHVRQTAEAVDMSCLLPFLQRELGSCSVMDMCNRVPYYAALVQVVAELSRDAAASVLCCSHHDGRSIAQLIAQLHDSAVHHNKILQSLSSTHSTMTVAAASADEQSSYHMCHLIIQTHEALTRALSNGAATAQQPPQQVNGTAQQAGQASSSTQDAAAEEERTYIATLQPLLVNSIASFSSGHIMQSTADHETARPRKRMVKVAQEVASLSQLLPLNASSSVFVAVNESNVVLWKALITGPDATPYDSGCFIFDIYFPPTYPDRPPQVQLCTTGGGQVRFNPNLYNCGKVCLSLLGTWAGGRSETWNPEVSTMVQVLISIQSLILVPEPYFNEPGFEAYMHEERGRLESRAYNENIREQCIHRAMIDYLKKPPVEFADVINNHFRLRREHIKRTCARWVDEAQSHGSSPHARRLQSRVNELTKLLDRL